MNTVKIVEGVFSKYTVVTKIVPESTKECNESKCEDCLYNLFDGMDCVPLFWDEKEE